MSKKVPALQGAIATFGMIADMAVGREVPGRDDVLNDKWDDIEVDSCVAFDTGAWETGVQRNGKPWEIVEQYEDRDAAVIGHAKWVALLRVTPEADLPNEVYWDGL